jgi:D-amino-acid oxidase
MDQVRGQLVLVKAPYVRMAMGEYNTQDRSYPTYIYPRRDHVVLGSTYLEGDGDMEVREETTEDVIRRAAEFIPEIATAPILAEVVCIRPGRKEGVRLEHELVQGGFHVVHNYGHGGAGMSLAWGCAGEVVDHVNEATSKMRSAPWSKSKM